jgi:hypothetical protein
MTDQPQLLQLAGTFRDALSSFTTLTPVPDSWLHLTMQGIGFTDDIGVQQIDRLAEAARARIGRLREARVSFGDVVVGDEAIALVAASAEPIIAMRLAARRAMADVLGEDQVAENADRFRPHASLAYVASDGPALPYIAAVEAIEACPATALITHVDLIEMHRDDRMYQWQVIASA